MIFDLIIVYFLKCYFEKRKGTEIIKIPKKALKFTCWLIPIKLILIGLSMGQLLPSFYKKDGKRDYILTDFEESHYGTAVWSMTLFYPVWGTYIYLTTWNRSNDKDFRPRYLSKKLGSKCQESKWTNTKICEEYLSSISGLVNFKDEYINGVITYWAKNPNRLCKTSWHAKGSSDYFKESANKKYPNRIDRYTKKRWILTEGYRMYEKHFKSIIERSALNGCEKSAKINFAEIRFGERGKGLWYEGEESAKYLRFICDNYEEACNTVWRSGFSIAYRENMKLANSLHKEICSKYDYRLCNIPRNISLTEFNKYNQARKKLEKETGKKIKRYPL